MIDTRGHTRSTLPTYDVSKQEGGTPRQLRNPFLPPSSNHRVRRSRRTRYVCCASDKILPCSASCWPFYPLQLQIQRHGVQVLVGDPPDVCVESADEIRLKRMRQRPQDIFHCFGFFVQLQQYRLSVSRGISALSSKDQLVWFNNELYW